MKKIIVIIASLCSVLFFMQTTSAKNKYHIKIAGMKPKTDPESIAMYKFKENLEKISHHKFKVRVYPNNSLGKEDAYMDLGRKGSIQMFATGTQTAEYWPPMALTEAPGLWVSLDHAHKALTGETGKIISSGLEKASGLKVLNFFPLGYRVFFTSKKVTKFEDYKNMRMRMPNIPLYLNFAKEMGISAQPLAFAELPSALDQGVVSGGGDPYPQVYDLKLYEKAPYIQETKHILVVHSLYINAKYYNGLSKKEQKWVDEAAKKAADYIWGLTAKMEKEVPNKLRKIKSVHILVPDAEFKQKVLDAGRRTWAAFKKEIPLAGKIFESADSYK